MINKNLSTMKKLTENELLGNIPPQSKETEEAVLGALILENDLFYTVSSMVTSETFYFPEHRQIYEAVKSLHQENKPVDLLSVTQTLNNRGELQAVGGPMYITQLTSRISQAAHIEYHAAILAQKYIQREIIRIAHETLREAYSPDADIDGLLDNLNQKVSAIEGYATGASTGKTQSEVITKAIEEIESDCLLHEKGLQPGIPTGLKNLERLVSGGWRNTNFIIVASRPGVGKTSLALHFIKTAAKYGKWVNFYGLEMTAQDVMKIMIAAETDISRANIGDGDLSDTDWHKINKASAALEKYRIIWNDDANLNVNHIKNITRKNRRLGRCDMVIIDYLQLISPTDRKQIREQQIAEISRTLKKLALEENIPVIILAQLNRIAETEKPALHHLRESGSLEQDADIVILPYRDLEDSSYNLIVAKNRRGKVGTIEVFVDEEYRHFTDTEQTQNNCNF